MSAGNCTATSTWSTANLALTVIGVQRLTWLGLPYLGSKVVTSGVVAAINYVAFRLWVIR